MTGQTGQTMPKPPFVMGGENSGIEQGRPKSELRLGEPTPEQVEAVAARAREIIKQNLANFLGPEQKWVVEVVMKEVEAILGAGNFDATVAMQNLQPKLLPLDTEAKNLVAKCLQKLQDVMGSEQTSPRGPDLKNNTDQPPTALAA